MTRALEQTMRNQERSWARRAKRYAASMLLVGMMGGWHATPAAAASCCTKSPNFGGGCDEATCQSCVCAVNPLCCTVSWTDACVAIAQGSCYDQCACANCGDGACTGPETACSCPQDCGPTTCGDGCCGDGETCASCPGDCGACTGDCCTNNGSAGCDEQPCQDCVCGLDAFCCNTTWDGLCAEQARNDCYDQCSCATCGDGACTDGETPCSCPDDCGPSCGNGTCDSCEDCVSCPGDCGGCTGDCCASNGSIGCNEQSCQGCVCALDAYCCGVLWDGVCAAEAENECYDQCSCATCGDGACTDGETSCSCPEDCGPTTCGDGCCGGDETCASCPGDCGACTGDCCTNNGSAGCDEQTCQDCVCAIDPYCCGTAWDDICAGEAQNECYDQCACAKCGDGACTDGETCATCAADCGACGCTVPPGDLTGDATTNVVDVQCDILTTLWVLGAQSGPVPSCLRTDMDPLVAGDFNCDGQVNVADVQALVSLSLGMPLSPFLDGDANGCPDACEAP